MQFAKKGLYRTYWAMACREGSRARGADQPEGVLRAAQLRRPQLQRGRSGDDERIFERAARGDRVHPRDRAQSQVGAPRTRQDRRI